MDKVEQGVCLRVSRVLSSNTAIILCSDHSFIVFVRGKVELLETNAIGKGLDRVSHLYECAITISCSTYGLFFMVKMTLLNVVKIWVVTDYVYLNCRSPESEEQNSCM